jgi:hypothetical protein
MTPFDKAEILSEIASAIEHAKDHKDFVKRLRGRRDELMRQVADEHRATLSPEQLAAFDAEEA